MIFKILSTPSVHTPLSVFNMSYFHVVGMAEFCIKLFTGSAWKPAVVSRVQGCTVDEQLHLPGFLGMTILVVESACQPCSRIPKLCI